MFQRKACILRWCYTRQYNISCVKVCGGHTSIQRILKSFCKEADDCMLVHVNHAVKVKKFQKVTVASLDTDVFVNLVYHFTRWIYADMEQFWIISGKKRKPECNTNSCCSGKTTRKHH